MSRWLGISYECIRQTIRKFDKFYTVATKAGAARTLNVIEGQK